MAEKSNIQTFRMSFGSDRALDLNIDPERVIWQHYGPDPLEDPAAAIRTALKSPIDFPALSQAVIPDDRVVIAAEPDTPGLSIVLREIWRILESRGLQPENITILQAAGADDPRVDLPDAVRGQIRWTLHDPEDSGGLAYLASTTGGERIQLARALTDADVVLSVGPTGFDPVLGFRGTNSAFYPALSANAAVEKARGQGHVELEPDDSRPLRQIVDEVGWLLGTQFTVQTIPAAGGGVGAVLAGSIEPVFRRGKEFLASELLVTPDERPDVVVVSVTKDAGGHGWKQVAAAIAMARRLVAREGRIVVLSELNQPCGPGLEILRQHETAADAIKPLRVEAPVDLIPATQIAAVVRWADVYLLSQLDGDLVQELFMFPLDNTEEAVKLIEQSEGSVALINHAQHVHGRIADSSR